jgi:hypothetical protein
VVAAVVIATAAATGCLLVLGFADPARLLPGSDSPAARILTCYESVRTVVLAGAAVWLLLRRRRHPLRLVLILNAITQSGDAVVGLANATTAGSRAREGAPPERPAIMSATLRLTREAGFGIELRRGRFEISVDGNDVGSLDDHETVETPLTPGRHTVQIRHGRYSSRGQSFDAADGEVVSFRCHGARVWPIYVASIAVPSLAIALKRE